MREKSPAHMSGSLFLMEKIYLVNKRIDQVFKHKHKAEGELEVSRSYKISKCPQQVSFSKAMASSPNNTINWIPHLNYRTHSNHHSFVRAF